MALSDGIVPLKKAVPYIPGRFICPMCNERYGKPEPHGFMDLKKCAPCEATWQEKIREPYLRIRRDYD